MSLTLLDWRRRTHDLYAAARAADDPAEAWQGWRDGRDEMFGNHPESPLTPAAKHSFAALPFAPYDPALRFVVPVERAEPAHRDVPTGTDGIAPFDRIGVLRLAGLGTLDVWWLGSYGGGLFVPFRDATAGRGSYGAGRYLIDTVKGADLGGDAAGLIVDLNFAYHPSCAYDATWACPLPADGNRLDAEVVAGEQLPPGGWPE